MTGGNNLSWSKCLENYSALPGKVEDIHTL